MPKIKELLELNLDIDIKNVIDLEDQAEDEIRYEIYNYIVTENIGKHIATFASTFNSNIKETGVWVSGFYGSGKSYFGKMLGYLLANKEIMGTPAIERLIPRLAGLQDAALIEKDLRKISNGHTRVVSLDIAKQNTEKGLAFTLFRKFLNNLGFLDTVYGYVEYQLYLDGDYPAFKEKVKEVNQYVQITVVPFGNKTTVEEEFRNLIDRGNGGFDRDIGVIDGDEGLLSSLSKNPSNTMEERIDSLKSTLFDIYGDEIMTTLSAKDKRFVSHIQGLKPEQIDRIRCWFPEDSLEVKYSLKGGDGFKPVEQGSPGQKTAALLAFILSYGSEPLILDQPEDDLDNHLIYDLIVKQLRAIKQKRQILIVTHNANIVVNGDAENVIALDIKSGQTRILSQGGLQDSSIRNEICRVMEGGKEAFDQRYKRINSIW